MAEPTLIDSLNAVNAYAEYLTTLHAAGRQFHPVGMSAQATQERALRAAALQVLEAAQDWPELEKRDGQHIVLQAPDGSRVLYTYENAVERLTLLDETPAPLPLGVCDACAAPLPADYLTVSLRDAVQGSVDTYRVCSTAHAEHLRAAQGAPRLGLHYEARSLMDRSQFRVLDQAAKAEEPRS